MRKTRPVLKAIENGTGEVPKWYELKVEARRAMNAEDGVITEGCRDQNT